MRTSSHNFAPPAGSALSSQIPPWAFENWSHKGTDRGAVRHYPVMSTEEICALPVPLLAAESAALFLWCTWPLMADWLRVVKAWDFEYKSLAWEWIKFDTRTGKYAFGGGYGTRKNLEPCLLCTRGDPVLRSDGDLGLFGTRDVSKVRSVRDFIQVMPLDCIRSPRREHSRKPDEQYARIETLFDGPYIELFARSQRQKWCSWGNDTERFLAGARDAG